MLNSPEFEVIKKEVNSHYYRFTIQAIERPFYVYSLLLGRIRFTNRR